MAKLNESKTYKEIMRLSDGIVTEKYLEEGFILKALEGKITTHLEGLLLAVTDVETDINLTPEQLKLEYRTYRMFFNAIIKHWMEFSKEIDIYTENTKIKKSSLKKKLKITQKQLEIITQATTENKYQKEFWSMEEAAKEMGIKKKSLQTKISEWKKEGIPLPWLIKQKGMKSYVNKTEFLNWRNAKKKAGRPPKQT